MCGGYKGDRARRRNGEETGGIQRYQDLDIRGQLNKSKSSTWTLTDRQIDQVN